MRTRCCRKFYTSSQRVGTTCHTSKKNFIKMKQILQKIEILNNAINQNHFDKTDTERILLKSSKLPEEVGEFYSELLISLGFTRDGKDGNREELEKELADVIITSLVIARELNIDIEYIIEKKLEKVISRLMIE